MTRALPRMPTGSSFSKTARLWIKRGWTLAGKNVGNAGPVADKMKMMS